MSPSYEYPISIDDKHTTTMVIQLLSLCVRDKSLGQALLHFHLFGDDVVSSSAWLCVCGCIVNGGIRWAQNIPLGKIVSSHFLKAEPSTGYQRPALLRIMPTARYVIFGPNLITHALHVRVPKSHSASAIATHSSVSHLYLS